MYNIVRIFDRITKLKQELHDEIEELKGDRDRDEARDRERRLCSHKASVRHELSQLLVSVRSKRKNETCLDNFFDEHGETAEKIFKGYGKAQEAIDMGARIAKSENALSSTPLSVS